MLAAEGVWRRATYVDPLSGSSARNYKIRCMLENLVSTSASFTASLLNLTFFHGALWLCIVKNRDCETARR